MRPRGILYINAWVMLFLGLAMLPCLALALADDSNDTLPLLISAIVALALGAGGLLGLRRREGLNLKRRESYLAVLLAWTLAGLVGALPFYFQARLNQADPAWAPQTAAHPISICELPADQRHPAKEFCNYTDAVFESVSGFTTTGASVISAGLWDSLDSQLSEGKPGLPRGMLLWRALIQWLGGMGILVLVMTVLTVEGGGGTDLMAAEVPGPTPGRLTPRAADTARLFWKVYVIMSLAQVAALMAGGMDLFNAVAHTGPTMATGGFSTLRTSVMGMNSPYFEWVITFFMLAAGANFVLHYYLLFRRRVVYWRDSEFKGYLAVVAVAVVLVGVDLWNAGLWEGAEGTLRTSAFQVASIITTTGFATRDFALWPAGSQLLLLGLMLLGACAGSTGGGIKVVRVMVGVQAAFREILTIVQPRAVAPIRMSGSVIPERVVRENVGVAIFFVLGFMVTALIVAMLGSDLVTAVSAAASCIGNVGPGLNTVGPMADYHLIHPLGKWALTIAMLAGRMEMYTVLILLSPHFWRR